MINNTIKFTIILFILFFFIFIFNYYFSEKNTNLVKSNRNNFEVKMNESILELPVLLNNTVDVIEFNSGFENTNKRSFKRNFWELFK